jgi:hypothetical protein
MQRLLIGADWRRTRVRKTTERDLDLATLVSRARSWSQRPEGGESVQQLMPRAASAPGLRDISAGSTAWEDVLQQDADRRSTVPALPS